MRLKKLIILGLVSIMLIPAVADAHRGRRAHRHRHGNVHRPHRGHNDASSSRLVEIARRVKHRANHLYDELQRDVNRGHFGWDRYRGDGDRSLAAARTLAHRAREFKSQVDSFWSTPYSTRSAYNALHRAYNRAERAISSRHAYRDLQAVGRALQRLSYYYDRGYWYSNNDYDEWDAVGHAIGGTIGLIAALDAE